MLVRSIDERPLPREDLPYELTLEGEHSIKFLQVLGLPSFHKDGTMTQDITQLNSISYWNGLYVLPVIAFCIAYTCMITLIPCHNQLECPSCWYEIALLMLLNTFLISIWTIIDCYYCFRASFMISFPTFFRLYIPSTILSIIPYCVLMPIWIHVLDYNPPLPLTGFLLILTVPAFPASLWFEIASTFKDTKDRKRLLWYISTIGYIVVIITSYYGITILAEKLPPTFEWIVAIVLPLFRAFHIWALSLIHI